MPHSDAEETELLTQGLEAIADGHWSMAAAAFRTLLERRKDADALFGLGIASFWLGETRSAMLHWEQAYVAYRRRRDPSQAVNAAVYLSLAARMSLGNLAAASGWLGRAARLVTDHGLGEHHGWVVLCRADLAIDTGRPLAAEAWAREAGELARAAGDLDLELCALSELGAALVEQGRGAEGTALLDEAMAGALAGEGLNLDSVVLISCRTITACSRGGDLRRATQWVRAADDFYRRHGSPHLYTTCRTHYGGILFATGSWEAAESELKAALRIGEDAEPELHAEALATLAEMRVAQGRLEEAGRLLAGYEDHPAVAQASALLALADGRASAAEALLRRRLREIDDDCLEASALGELLAVAQLELGASDQAAERGLQLARRRSEASADVIRARGERVLGRTMLAQSRLDEAIAHLERAVSAFVTAKMPIEAGRTRLLLAQALAPNARDAAVTEAQRAFAAFEKVGALRDADAVAALLRSLGARAARSGPRAIGLLTKRELEVLALLGEGLSNPEIGARLFITRKTVEHHVASLLAKTGLSGRGEAAAFAVRELRSEPASK
jgi:ATP/maltotriose-dependent transcriptional regulator MalT